MRTPILLLGLILGAFSAKPSSRPNILLITSDDNGPHLGCYGDPFARTPHLDRLAEEGVRFDNAYVPQAGCSQSRAAYLTGLYPHQNGQIGLATWKFRMYQEDTPNMVRALKQAGYRTGLIGKLHVSPETAFPFDFKERNTGNYGRHDLPKYATLASEFLASTDGAPFFLNINYPDPHRPFLEQVDGLPDDPLRARDVRSLPHMGIDTPKLREDTANYYNSLERLDRLIGDLFAVIIAAEVWENTVVIYLGDHGPDLLRGKRTPYEGGTRVPLILRVPQTPRNHPAHDELVNTIDLFPTVIEIAGLPEVPNLPGRSLLPLLEDSASLWRPYLFTEFHLHSPHNYYPSRTIRDDRFKLIHNLISDQENPGYRFTQERFYPELPTWLASSEPEVRAAYESMRRPQEYELYDLQADPYEFTDLITEPAYASVKERLLKELYDWRRRSNDPFLIEKNTRQLRQELSSSVRDGLPRKEALSLNYDRYFFREE